MARQATGQVVVRKRASGRVYALRFRAYGERQYVTLGTDAEGWDRRRAEAELESELAKVRAGVWRPVRPEAAPAPPTDPTFHEFASQWVQDNEAGWRPNTRLDYTWQLSNHLLPFFAKHRLSQITVAEVDRYRAAKLREASAIAARVEQGKARTLTTTNDEGREFKHREKPLSATSINKTITRLAQILDVAVEYEIIDRNPARGKRRRVKASKPAPVWLDRAEHIGALLDAAAALDREAREDRQHIPRQAILGMLVFAGLRLGELLDLRWRDVDLSAGRITVRASKTDAGMRQVDVLPALKAILEQLPRRGPDMLVFATREDNPLGASNIRRRVLDPAVMLADQRLEGHGEVPLPVGLSPHKLRHTFASLLVALGVDPGAVMDQLGHTDPTFTMRVYRHGMRRDQASREALARLVGAAEKAPMGTNVVSVEFTRPVADSAATKKASLSRTFASAPGRI